MTAPILLAAVLTVPVGAPAPVPVPVPVPILDAWHVDAAHTEVSFQARHFFTKVRGQFREFEIDFDYDEANPARSSVDVVIQVASVNTGNERRDDHLRTADWFEVERFPVIRFRSERVEVVSADEYRVHGVLTIRDVSRRYVLPVQRTGIEDVPPQMRDMMNGAKKIAGFEGELTVDRTDFGVGSGDWAMTTVVGAPIEIQIAMEAHLR